MARIPLYYYEQKESLQNSFIVKSNLILSETPKAVANLRIVYVKLKLFSFR